MYKYDTTMVERHLDDDTTASSQRRSKLLRLIKTPRVIRFKWFYSMFCARHYCPFMQHCANIRYNRCKRWTLEKGCLAGQRLVRVFLRVCVRTSLFSLRLVDACNTTITSSASNSAAIVLTGRLVSFPVGSLTFDGTIRGLSTARTFLHFGVWEFASTHVARNTLGFFLTSFFTFDLLTLTFLTMFTLCMHITTSLGTVVFG